MPRENCEIVCVALFIAPFIPVVTERERRNKNVVRTVSNRDRNSDVTFERVLRQPLAARYPAGRATIAKPDKFISVAVPRENESAMAICRVKIVTSVAEMLDAVK